MRLNNICGKEKAQRGEPSYPPFLSDFLPKYTNQLTARLYELLWPQSLCDQCELTEGS